MADNAVCKLGELKAPQSCCL